MAQAVESWDSTLLGCPQVSGYNASRETVLRVGEPLDGSRRYRQRLEEPMTTFEVTVPQTLAQYEAWVAFYEDLIDFGKDWFYMDLALGTDMQTFLVHLSADWGVSQVAVDASFGELQMTLEAFEKASTVLVFDPPIVIDGGTVAAPSPEGDLVDAGTALTPAPATDIVFGGDYVDIQL